MSELLNECLQIGQHFLYENAYLIQSRQKVCPHLDNAI
jgi:hypothetical protein